MSELFLSCLSDEYNQESLTNFRMIMKFGFSLEHDDEGEVECTKNEGKYQLAKYLRNFHMQYREKAERGKNPIRLFVFLVQTIYFSGKGTNKT